MKPMMKRTDAIFIHAAIIYIHYNLASVAAASPVCARSPFLMPFQTLHVLLATLRVPDLAAQYNRLYCLSISFTCMTPLRHSGKMSIKL